MILQTYYPEHYAFSSLATGDYSRFCEEELRIRKELRYPPFVRLLCVLLEGRNSETLSAILEEWARRLAYLFSEDLEVLGPVPAYPERLRGRYRWKLLIKAPPLEKAFESCLKTLQNFSLPHSASLRLVLDVDPQDLF